MIPFEKFESQKIGIVAIILVTIPFLAQARENPDSWFKWLEDARAEIQAQPVTNQIDALTQSASTCLPSKFRYLTHRSSRNLQRIVDAAVTDVLSQPVTGEKLCSATILQPEFAFFGVSEDFKSPCVGRKNDDLVLDGDLASSRAGITNSIGKTFYFVEDLSADSKCTGWTYDSETFIILRESDWRSNLISAVIAHEIYIRNDFFANWDIERSEKFLKNFSRLVFKDRRGKDLLMTPRILFRVLNSPQVKLILSGARGWNFDQTFQKSVDSHFLPKYIRSCEELGIFESLSLPEEFVSEGKKTDDFLLAIESVRNRRIENEFVETEGREWDVLRSLRDSNSKPVCDKLLNPQIHPFDSFQKFGPRPRMTGGDGG